MKESNKISVKTRDSGSKKEEGLIPAVLYGAKRKSTPLFVSKDDFEKLYKEAGESTLIALDIDDKKDKATALIYEVQKHPLTGDIMHADFFEPNLKEEVEAEIPLNFVGEAPAVKEFEGTLVKNMYTVNVKALPQNLPHDFEVNVEKLKTLDDVFTVNDLQIPTDVEILHEAETAIAMISRPENVEEELEKPIEEGEEPEVVGEKEKEEKEAEEEDKKEKAEEKAEEKKEE